MNITTFHSFPNRFGHRYRAVDEGAGYVHIASIRIKNFRLLKDIEIPLARATVSYRRKQLG